jgi:hypothetical protein
MTSSSSSGGPKPSRDEQAARLSQELEDSQLCKASPRKAFCPPYRGFGIDFSHFTRLMLSEMGQLPPTTKLSLFNKKPLLSIAKLKVREKEIIHLKKDKLSDKLGRRDVKFYDLYKHRKDEKDVIMINEQGF